MYLKRVCINSFKSISYAEIELSPHLNCITGPNGVGKSNFLDAILFALTVPLKQLRVECLKDLISKSGSNFKRYSKSTSVTLTFCQRKGTDQHVLTAKVIVNDQNEHVFYQIDNKNKKKQEVRRWLKEVCNITVDFEDNSEMYFNFVIAQNIVTRIPFLSNENKWKFILNAAGTIDWERNKNNAYKEINKCTLQLNLIQSNIEKLDQMLGKEKDLIVKLKYMKKLEHDIDMLKQKICKVKSFNLSQKIVKTKQLIEELEKSEGDFEISLEITKSKLKSKEELLNESIQKSQKQSDIFGELQTKESTLLNQLHLLKEKSNWRKKKYDENEKEYYKALSHISKLEEEIRSIEVNSIIPLKSKLEAISLRQSSINKAADSDNNEYPYKLDDLHSHIDTLISQYKDLEKQLEVKEKNKIDNLSKLHQLELNNNFGDIKQTFEEYDTILSNVESIDLNLITLEKEKIFLESQKNRYKGYFFTFSKKIQNYLGLLCDSFMFTPLAEKYSKALSEILPINVLSVHIVEDIKTTNFLLEECQKCCKSSVRIWPLDRIKYYDIETVKSKIQKNDINHMIFPCDLISIKDEKFRKPIFHSPLSSWIIVQDKLTGEKLIKKYPNLKFITSDGKNKLSLGTLVGSKKEGNLLTFTEIKIKLDIVENKINELNSRKQILIIEKDKLEKKIASFNQYEFIRKGLEIDEEAIAILKNNLNEISKNINQKKIEIEFLNIRGERSSLEKERIKIEKKLSTLVSQSEALQYELDEQRNEIKEKFSIRIENKDNKFEDEISQIEMEIEHLVKEKLIKKEKLEELDQLIYTLKAEVDSCFDKIKTDENNLKKIREDIKLQKKMLEKLLEKNPVSNAVPVSMEDITQLKYSLKQNEAELSELVHHVFGSQSNKKISKVLNEKTGDLIILEEKLKQLEEFKYKTELVRHEIEKLKEGILSSKENIDKMNNEAKNNINEILHGMCLNAFPSKHIELINTTDGIDFQIKEGNSIISIESLSGGEKTLLALCFLLSTLLHQFLKEKSSNSSKIMLLDEVDAALDEINCHRAYNLIKDNLISKDCQVISISHHSSFSKLAQQQIIFSKKQDTEFTTIKKVIVRR